jgi:Zn-dependent peptidase ImmA (M78 family)
MNLANRLRQRRLVLGYTLDEVTELVEKQGHTISKAAVSKYELGKSVPNATNLWHLACVLEASPEYFLKAPRFEIQWIAFRKNYALSKKEIEKIRYFAKEQVEARLFLNEVLGLDIELPENRKYAIKKYEDVEEVALAIREKWKIDKWPIESLSSTLESKSIFLVEIESAHQFDGLSGWIDDTYPLIITTKNTPVDRKRMNIAHEFAHTILDIRNEAINEEKAAFRLAAALLIPEGAIKNALGSRRKKVDLQELVLLKEDYGISVQALIRRCYDLHIISEVVYKQMNIMLRSRGMHINEPGECNNKEKPIMVKGRVLRAIAEGYTTESEVLSRFPALSSEIELSQKPGSWKAKDESELLRKSAQKLKSEYAQDGTLSDLEIVDELYEY